MFLPWCLLLAISFILRPFHLGSLPFYNDCFPLHKERHNMLNMKTWKGESSLSLHLKILKGFFLRLSHSLSPFTGSRNLIYLHTFFIPLLRLTLSLHFTPFWACFAKTWYVLLEGKERRENIYLTSFNSRKTKFYMSSYNSAHRIIMVNSIRRRVKIFPFDFLFSFFLTHSKIKFTKSRDI